MMEFRVHFVLVCSADVGVHPGTIGDAFANAGDTVRPTHVVETIRGVLPRVRIVH